MPRRALAPLHLLRLIAAALRAQAKVDCAAAELMAGACKSKKKEKKGGC